ISSPTPAGMAGGFYRFTRLNRGPTPIMPPAMTSESKPGRLRLLALQCCFTPGKRASIMLVSYGMEKTCGEIQPRQSKETRSGSIMVEKVARLSVVLLLTGLLVSPAGFGQDKKTSNKKNSDVDSIGDRDINKRSINFTSLQKEQQLGRELAAEVE